MNAEYCLFSAAYFPSTHYLAQLSKCSSAIIESCENYSRQTYRNRCSISSAGGLLNLSVPVLRGSFHKTKIRDIRIDYSKRWQQMHLRALSASYRSSPFFEYFFPEVEVVITSNHKYLLDLDLESIRVLNRIIGIGTKIVLSEIFTIPSGEDHDYRYSINPKLEKIKPACINEYRQVFADRHGFIPGLSTLDLIFNTGPDAINYL